jgi:hypothetical protein
MKCPRLLACLGRGHQRHVDCHHVAAADDVTGMLQVVRVIQVRWDAQRNRKGWGWPRGGGQQMQ